MSTTSQTAAESAGSLAVPALTLFGVPLGLLYGSANEQITDRLVNALLDPRYAGQMMGGKNAAASAGSRALPVNQLAIRR